MLIWGLALIKGTMVPIMFMAQFRWIILLKNHMQFSNYVLLFGTNHSIIANIGPRVDPFFLQVKTMRIRVSYFRYVLTLPRQSLFFYICFVHPYPSEIWTFLYSMKLSFGSVIALDKSTNRWSDHSGHVITM